MLELAILGLLKERPMHGYQLSRELSEAHGPFWRVSYGSLYPSLRRLERDGGIETTKPATRSDDAGAGGGRGKGRRKTVYRITERGEELFLELLQETPNEGQTEDARFGVRLAFFRYLPPETRIRLLERRRDSLEERLGELTEALRTAKTDDDYQRSLMEHGRVATESDIAWLTGLIHTERGKRTTAEAPRYRGSERRATATLRRKERTS